MWVLGNPSPLLCSKCLAHRNMPQPLLLFKTASPISQLALNFVWLQLTRVPRSHVCTSISNCCWDLLQQPCICDSFLCLCFCSDMGSRAGYPAQVYKTASAETPRPSQLTQCSPFQLSTSVPKSFFSKQPAHNKHPTGWKRTDEPPARPLPFTDTKK